METRTTRTTRTGTESERLAAGRPANESELTVDATRLREPDSEQVTQTIDWYAEGQARTVVLEGREITIRFIGRKGRRGRICITAPAGARFVER